MRVTPLAALVALVACAMSLVAVNGVMITTDLTEDPPEVDTTTESPDMQFDYRSNTVPDLPEGYSARPTSLSFGDVPMCTGATREITLTAPIDIRLRPKLVIDVRASDERLIRTVINATPNGASLRVTLYVTYHPQQLVPARTPDVVDVTLRFVGIARFTFGATGYCTTNPYQLEPITPFDSVTQVPRGRSFAYKILVYNPLLTTLNLKSVEYGSSPSLSVMMTEPINQYDNDATTKKNWEVAPKSWSQLLGTIVFASEWPTSTAGVLRLEFESGFSTFQYFNFSIKAPKPISIALGMLSPVTREPVVQNVELLNTLGAPLAIRDAYMVSGGGGDDDDDASAATNSEASAMANEESGHDNNDDDTPRFFRGGGHLIQPLRCAHLRPARGTTIPPHTRGTALVVEIRPWLCGGNSANATDGPKMLKLRLRAHTNHSNPHLRDVDVALSGLVVEGGLTAHFLRKTLPVWTFIVPPARTAGVESIGGALPQVEEEAEAQELFVESHFRLPVTTRQPDSQRSFLKMVGGPTKQSGEADDKIFSIGRFVVERARLPQLPSRGTVEHKATPPIVSSTVGVPVSLREDGRAPVNFTISLPVVAITQPLLTATPLAEIADDTAGISGGEAEARVMDDEELLAALSFGAENAGAARYATKVAPFDLAATARFVHPNARAAFLNVARHAAFAHFGVVPSGSEVLLEAAAAAGVTNAAPRKKVRLVEAVLRTVRLELINVHNVTVFVQALRFTPQLTRGPRICRVSAASLASFAIAEQHDGGIGSIRAGEKVIITIELLQSAGDFSAEDFAKQAGSISGALIIDTMMRQAGNSGKFAPLQMTLPISFVSASGSLAFGKQVSRFLWLERTLADDAPVSASPAPGARQASPSTAQVAVDPAGVRELVIRKSITVITNFSHDVEVTDMNVLADARSRLSMAPPGLPHDAFRVTFARSLVPAGFRGIAATVEFLTARAAAAAVAHNTQAPPNTEDDPTGHGLGSSGANNGGGGSPQGGRRPLDFPSITHIRDAPNALLIPTSAVASFGARVRDSSTIESATFVIKVGCTTWRQPIEAQTGVPILSKADVDFGVVELHHQSVGSGSAASFSPPIERFVTLTNEEPFAVQVQLALLHELYDEQQQRIIDTPESLRILKEASRVFGTYRRKARNIRLSHLHLQSDAAIAAASDAVENDQPPAGSGALEGSGLLPDDVWRNPSKAFGVGGPAQQIITIPPFTTLSNVGPIYFYPSASAGATGGRDVDQTLLVLRTNTSAFDFVPVRGQTGLPLVQVVTEPAATDATTTPRDGESALPGALAPVEHMHLNVTSKMLGKWPARESGGPTIVDVLWHLVRGAPVMDEARNGVAELGGESGTRAIGSVVAPGEWTAGGMPSQLVVENPVRSRQNPHFRRVVHVVNRGAFPIEVRGVDIGGHACGSRAAVQLHVFPCITSDQRVANRVLSTPTVATVAEPHVMPLKRLEPDESLALLLIFEPTFIIPHQTTVLSIRASTVTEKPSGSRHEFATSVAVSVSVPVESLRQWRFSDVVPLSEAIAQLFVTAFAVVLIASMGTLAVTRSAMEKWRFEEEQRKLRDRPAKQTFTTPPVAATAAATVATSALETPRASGTAGLAKPSQVAGPNGSDAPSHEVATHVPAASARPVTSKANGSKKSTGASKKGGAGGSAATMKLSSTPGSFSESSLGTPVATMLPRDDSGSFPRHPTATSNDSIASSSAGAAVSPQASGAQSSSRRSSTASSANNASVERSPGGGAAADAAAHLARSEALHSELVGAEGRAREGHAATELHNREALRAAQTAALAAARSAGDARMKREQADRVAAAAAAAAAKVAAKVVAAPTDSPSLVPGPRPPVAVDADDLPPPSTAARVTTPQPSSPVLPPKPPTPMLSGSMGVAPIGADDLEGGTEPHSALSATAALSGSGFGVTPPSVDRGNAVRVGITSGGGGLANRCAEPSTAAPWGGSNGSAGAPSLGNSPAKTQVTRSTSSVAAPVATIAAIGEDDDDEDLNGSGAHAAGAWNSKLGSRLSGSGSLSGSSAAGPPSLSIRRREPAKRELGIGDRALAAATTVAPPQLGSASLDEATFGARGLGGSASRGSASTPPLLSPASAPIYRPGSHEAGRTGGTAPVAPPQTQPRIEPTTTDLQRILRSLHIAPADSMADGSTAAMASQLHDALTRDDDDDDALNRPAINDTIVSASAGMAAVGGSAVAARPSAADLFAAMTGSGGGGAAGAAAVGGGGGGHHQLGPDGVIGRAVTPPVEQPSWGVFGFTPASGDDKSGNGDGRGFFGGIW